MPMSEYFPRLFFFDTNEQDCKFVIRIFVLRIFIFTMNLRILFIYRLPI